jgi:prophage DNA circulation protein
MADLDILSKLPPLSWRGVEGPAQANSIRFEHGLVEHRQHGVDGGHQENTGRGSMVVAFRIPFRAGLLEYPDLYPTRFRDFWNACLDGSVGNLSHPEFGEFDAKVASFNLQVTPDRRDGYDVDVEFRETTENDITAADNPLGPIAECISIAKAFEADRAALSPVPEYDDGEGTDVLTALKQLEGSLILAEMTIAAKIAKINNVIGGVNSMIDTLNKSTDPKSWGVIDGLKSIESNLQATKEAISPNQKKIDFVIAPRETGVRDAAAAASMDLSDFYKLNPNLARKKTILTGETYFIQA